MVRIVANSGILGGKPIVEGTRLSVAHILGLLASGMSNQEIIADYPDLTEESIRAVLSYAARALQNDIIIEVVSSRDGVS